MTDITRLQTTAEYEAEFELLMQKAERLNAIMAADRIEIERLKDETILIKNETRTSRDETRALIAEMAREQQKGRERNDRENAKSKSENLLLRLENTQLRILHGLPPRRDEMVF